MEQAPHEVVVVKSAPWWASLLRLVLKEYQTATILIPDGPQEEDQEEVQEEVQEEQ